jgi:outer membrane receptor for ferrienterochelin and colicins
MLCRLAFLLLLTAGPAAAQHTLIAVVLDAHEREPLPGVHVAVENAGVAGATDAEGRVVLAGIPAGRFAVVVSAVGFETLRQWLVFPLAEEEVEFLLEEGHEHLDEIYVTATRARRAIADLPTRVEVVGAEEIEEKIAMRPGNISMLLNESPGITVQQTSAVTGNAGLRIQGLDGRYTQLLRDGFPLYGGFSGGLSLLQIPPLDLAQVEIVKGPVSTLFGGDAIAGLVNLVSKVPGPEPERLLLVNGSTAGGFDGGAFLSARGRNFGYTILASGALQRPYDADGDAFTDLPRTRRLTLAPRLFYYGADGTAAWIGASATAEDREGGDLWEFRDGPAPGPPYTERHRSGRASLQARLDRPLSDALAMTLKTSGTLFDRQIDVPAHSFRGHQSASYSEASGNARLGAHDLVAGLDLRTDAFREQEAGPRDYTYVTAGAFVQDTWDATERLVLEAGLRADHHNRFGTFVLPRASLLVRLAEGLSARAGGGLGYRAPTIFLEESEERAFRGVLALPDDARAETSIGGSLDLNYRTVLFDVLGLSLNQALYFTRLSDPLLPHEPTPGLLEYRNATDDVRTRSLETNARFSLDDFTLFLGYVNLEARRQSGDPLALVPRHRTYSVLVWEQHGQGRVGLEAYYTGPQQLTNGERVPGFLVAGVMAERRLGPARLFVNLENLTGTRQHRHAPVVLGPRSEPRFAEIWAPLEGFVANGGVRLEF